MFDNYLYRIESEKAFLAGYNKSSISDSANPVFLFTSLRIIRIISGSARWKIGGKIWEVSKNDIIVANNIESRQFVGVKESPLICEIFAFSPTVFKNEIGCLTLFYNRSEYFNPIINKTIPDVSEINTLLDLLKSKFQTYDLCCDSTKSVISSLITAIISDILSIMKTHNPKLFSDEAGEKNHNADIVAQAIKIINENISEPINVTWISAQLNVSRGYFTKVFSMYTGQTPAKFINRCRIDNVIQLLNTENINVLDAALASGFRSASGFYKTFHSICEMPPTKLSIKKHTLQEQKTFRMPSQKRKSY